MQGIRCTGVLLALVSLVSINLFGAEAELQSALASFLDAHPALIDSFAQGHIITQNSPDNIQLKAGADLNTELDFGGKYFTPLAVVFTPPFVDVALAQALIANGGTVAQANNKSITSLGVKIPAGFTCNSDGTGCSTGSAPAPTCSSKVGGSCSASNPCCTSSGLTCVSGTCQTPAPQCGVSGSKCTDSSDCCTSSGLVCNTTAGICAAACSSTDLNGYCDAGSTCDNGTCTKDCASGGSYCANNGVCVSGSCQQPCASGGTYCPNNGVCVSGSCEQPCASGGTYCAGDATCVSSACVPNCSGTAQSGYCQAGYTCVTGTCTQTCAAGGSYCPAGSSCQNKTCVVIPPSCSPAHPTAACSDSSQVCVSGVCQTTCANGGSYCATAGEQCVKNVCTPPCSGTNTSGFCLTAGQSCIQGSCQFPCNTSSQSNLTGACATAGEQCVAGVCTAACSSSVPNGYCTTAGQSCVGGTCQVACGVNNPKGACESGLTCVSGTCTAVCSASNQNGYCPPGQTCSGGSCLLAVGSSCTGMGQCAPGTAANPVFCCDTDGTCFAPQSVDAPTGSKTATCQVVTNSCSGLSAGSPKSYCSDDNACCTGACIGAGICACPGTATSC